MSSQIADKAAHDWLAIAGAPGGLSSAARERPARCKAAHVWFALPDRILGARCFGARVPRPRRFFASPGA
eukprot:823950-Pyramimonas_sp.AAC.1